MLKQKERKKRIAEILGVSASTITREIQRNSEQGRYNYKIAIESAKIRKDNKIRKRIFTDSIKRNVIYYLHQQWSPEQIHGYFKRQGISIVSVPTLYKFIYEDSISGGTLYKNLRTGRFKRRRIGLSKGLRGLIKDRVSIELRPPVVNLRERYGDWEVDTIVGKGNRGAIVTIVERVTGYCVLGVAGSKQSTFVSKQIINGLAPYKKLVHTITSDNGKEFAMHKRVSKKLGCEFYFAHPYSSWERGLSEYTNKLIRQYIKKSTNFNEVDYKMISDVIVALNNRPRKKLGYRTPQEVFFEQINK